MVLGRCVLISALAAACARTHPERNAAAAAIASADTARPWRKPGDRIDSILPMPEYLRRFRQDLMEPVRLTGGAASRDELARGFLAAVSTRDTAAFAKLAVTRSEFAWLVFPDHRYHNPPYQLDPAIFWIQLTAGSATGLHRTLGRYGGTRLSLIGLACDRDTLQTTSRRLRVWSGCRLRYRAGDTVETRALFGSVVERDGRLKILSFANGL